MTTPVYPADEIVHLDAVGQRIMPGDVVWASGNSSGIGARLVVKLTEHKVWVDKSSPKDGNALLVVTTLMKGLQPRSQYDSLMSRFGANIVTDVKSKAAAAPLRFMVLSHLSDVLPSQGRRAVDYISIHQIRGTTNKDAADATEAARTLSKNQLGYHHGFGDCLWKKPQSKNIGYDSKTGRYLYEDHDWNWTNTSAADTLLTIKRLEEAGIAHLPTNELITVDEFNRSVSDDRFKYKD